MLHHVFAVLLISVLSSVLILTKASAQACDPTDKNQCCSFNLVKNQTKTSRIQALDQTCSLSVVSQQTTRSFRRFGFASDGQVSVFMQPGGNSQRANATQSFLIYPFDENPTYEAGSGNNFSIDSGSGLKWTFDSATSLPVSLESCSLSVSPTFTLHDSGVNINSCPGHLVIETPVEVGGEYIAYPNRKMTIRDPQGHTCEIDNSDLYRYIEKSENNTHDRAGRYYNIKLKYSTNRELGQQLHRICPRLDVSMLTKVRPPFNLNVEGLTDPPASENEPEPEN